MKQISILFLYFLCSVNINAQDTITLKNRKVINAYIIEKSKTEIKYKLDTISAYTIFITKLTQIKTIQYNNGEVDLLSSQNPRSVFPLGVNVGFTGISMFSGSVDYFITPNISTEAYIKYIPSSNIGNVFSFGGKYWFANRYSKSGFSPYAGLFLLRITERNDYEDITWYNKPEWSIYYLPEVPVGISYITRFGLQTSLQLSFPFIFPELKIGWRFKTGKNGY
jgi:hypothetical protein